VAHTYNPSYSGGRNQETEVRSQPGIIIHKILSQISLSQKRAGRVAQGIGPEFKPQSTHTHTHTHTHTNSKTKKN
jgi:hypothetical protein